MQAPADVEYLVREYLKPLAGVPVSSKMTNDKNFLVAFSLGGPEATLVSGRPRLVFDCYGEREALAIKLAQRVWGLVKGLDGLFLDGVQFYEVEANLPVNLPHPDKPTLFRYQFNAAIHVHHAVIA
ncbi:MULTISPECIES: hypothetical protein [unclassified Glutamicibacter]|uniref:DUF3168 domain-containing protein n=1 Tax=Glutamicibacter bergerei TaxID=256702 RepID=A0ABV9MRL6_9MICC|nr:MULTISPECIES: hypothetical protein [unclassified Glutamicibacter]PCC29728.1 hypothetical protein CIK76_04865 [Glutamicibacter sp. BW80]PCC31449.1 hypothetical protein CIK74_17395 [Glutamicibacter sp. BW77]HBV11409.1 hypothetical protein [Micrococcaceae bacterium]